jgi:tRNA 2-thiouridine synthesizing protein A
MSGEASGIAPDGATMLDLKGLKCPLPALRTRRALSRAAIGDRLFVVCTDPMAAIDIPHLVRETGQMLEAQAKDEQTLTFTIRKTV